MVTYIQCKDCYDENSECKTCNGSGYIGKLSLKEMFKEYLVFIFPCLKETEKKTKYVYTQVKKDTDFYSDLFDTMNEMDSLLDEEEEVDFNNKVFSNNEPELNLLSLNKENFQSDTDSDYTEEEDNNEEKVVEKEENNKKARKIEIPLKILNRSVIR